MSSQADSTSRSVRHFSLPRTYAPRGLSPVLVHILRDVQQELGLFESSSTASNICDERTLESLIGQIAARSGLSLTRCEVDEIMTHVERDKRLFGILQPLVDDPSVTDIIVSSYSQISVREGAKILKTGISFSNQECYEKFVERLLHRAETCCSTKKPIADGVVGSLARVHAVHKSLSDGGPYLTIRLNRFPSITISSLLSTALAPLPIIEYLRLLVRAGITVLISGEVGCGKTTLARALASDIPHDESILVVEDTAEIRLDHPYVRYLTTRESNTEGEGRISPSQVIRAGMRMAMHRIIFGEIRDAEAAEAFIDVCSSGHPGLSTIHARSAADTLKRLELFLGRAQRGASERVILQQVATAVHVVVFLGACRVSGKRRVFEVREVGPVADGVLRQREMFRYELKGEIPHWCVCSKISSYKSILEAGDKGLALSSLPETLHLEFRNVQREGLAIGWDSIGAMT